MDPIITVAVGVVVGIASFGAIVLVGAFTGIALYVCYLFCRDTFCDD